MSIAEQKQMIEDVEGLASSIWGWMRGGEPLFLHWDRVPIATRNRLKNLRSEHLENVQIDRWK